MANKFLEKLEAILLQMKLNGKSELLTLGDAALILGFSKSYLYKLTMNRQIPHYKPIGKTIFFKRSELMSWIENSRVLTNAESVQNHKKVLHSKLK